ncbi:YcxB family protein [Streptomyces sp. NPDC052225]|uniref:YcxB family protein n=1 Tax=Streptomyces sp. NPDC052225 TaxID=3154949 RepID=UPI003444D21B
MDSTEIAAGEPVELEYRPTLRQYEEAGRARRAASGREGKAGGGALSVAVIAVLTVVRDPGLASAVLASMAIGALVGVFVVRPRREASDLHDRAVRRGGHRATIDADGVTVEHELGSERFTWDGLLSYRETDGLFVLFDDEEATRAVLLPKDRLSAPETDRLRTYLDGHLQQA